MDKKLAARLFALVGALLVTITIAATSKLAAVQLIGGGVASCLAAWLFIVIARD